jgi:gamma-glutamylcyclotransferase (GGCT)/AIG2-like uncharacterized protein YtfP
MAEIIQRTDIQKFVQETLDDNYYSADTASLFKTKCQPLFVYGTLRKGYSRHAAIEHAFRVGDAYTLGSQFRMYWTHTIKRTPFPVVLPAGASGQGAGIHGEFYLVHPEDITNLDFIESNGIMYHRQKRPIFLKVDGEDIHTMAWVYVGAVSYWNDHLKKGWLQECDILTRKKNPEYQYYTFMRKYVLQNRVTM